MSGLINLILQELPKLVVLPILSIILIVVSIGLYYFYREKKIVKYIPSLVIGIIAIIIGLFSLWTFTTEMGLNTAWIAVFLGTSALCGVITCFIIDLINSIRNNYKDLEEGKNYE